MKNDLSCIWYIATILTTTHDNRKSIMKLGRSRNQITQSVMELVGRTECTNRNKGDTTQEQEFRQGCKVNFDPWGLKLKYTLSK